ncbi:MAG: sideroflexin, partial [bacterium]
SDGINIQNKDGDETFGKSKVAAKKAITQTAISRVFLPLPVLFFPAVGQFLLTKLGMWPTRRLFIAKALELSLCAVALTFALPMSVALFQ